MSISEDLKTIKVNKSANFIPLSAKKDGKISKVAEAQQKETKLTEEELQENSFAFQTMKRADKASKNAMRFGKDHKDHEEAYTAHSDAHDAALSAAGHAGGYAYGSNNGVSHAAKKKYLKMAVEHLDHMMHHTAKEFPDSVKEEVKEIEVEEAEKHKGYTIGKGFHKKSPAEKEDVEAEIGKGDWHNAHRPYSASADDTTIHYNPKTKKAHADSDGGAQAFLSNVHSIHHAIDAVNHLDKHGSDQDAAVKATEKKYKK